MGFSPGTDAVLPVHRALAERVADAAAAVVRSYFRTPIAVEGKPDRSPVTVADREAEVAMRSLISAERPSDGIVGEEYGSERPDAEYVWVLDPIDGTKAFVSGKPSFGTLVALLHRGAPVLGIIDQPITHERWVGITTGTAGALTTLNGEPVRVRACPRLDLAMLYATAPEMFQGADAEAFARVRSAVRTVRYGADCYAYALLATGFVDLVAEASLQPHDFLALAPVVQGAGGVITDWSGGALGLQSGGGVLAAGDRRAHDQAMALLGGQ